MDTSQTSACEQLCIEEGEKGCCFLNTGRGCYWKRFAEATGDEGDTSLAVSCSSAGALDQNVRY